ncbi:MAG: hypothetical protein ACI4HO_02125 [Ruminococcus sp.]
MWVKVKKPFKDIHTGKLHKKGDKLNISKERNEEILSKGDFVEPCDKNKKEE